MKYFPIRVSRDGDMAFFAEGPGPAPPAPSDHPVCWRVRCHKNGQVTREMMSVENAAMAIASTAAHDPGYLLRTETEPFDSLEDAVAWLLDEAFEHDVECLERMITQTEARVAMMTEAGNEVGARRAKNLLEELLARREALDPT